MFRLTAVPERPRGPAREPTLGSLARMPCREGVHIAPLLLGEWPSLAGLICFPGQPPLHHLPTPSATVVGPSQQGGSQAGSGGDLQALHLHLWELWPHVGDTKPLFAWSLCTNGQGLLSRRALAHREALGEKAQPLSWQAERKQSHTGLRLWGKCPRVGGGQDQPTRSALSTRSVPT